MIVKRGPGLVAVDLVGEAGDEAGFVEVPEVDFVRFLYSAARAGLQPGDVQIGESVVPFDVVVEPAEDGGNVATAEGGVDVLNDFRVGHFFTLSPARGRWAIIDVL